MNPKILVMGAGAIGGITGGMLADEHDVTLFDVDERHVEKIRNKGLIIDGIRGRKVVKVKAVRRIRGKYDVIFIAVKSQHTRDALRRCLPHLKEDGVVVSLQNSINEEIIAEKVGIERTIGCVIGWSATNIDAGHLKLTSEGEFIIGKLNGKIDKKLEMVKKLLEKVAPVKITKNIMGHLWTKLIINSAIASIGAIGASTLGKIAKDRTGVSVLALTADELVRIAEKLNLKLEEFEGMDPSFFKIDNYEDFLRAIGIIRMAAKKHSSLKSTILQDLEKGKKTEIDYLNGYIERVAENHGIKTHINRKIIEIIKEIEDGKREINDKNIKEIYEILNIPEKWLEFRDKDLELAIFNLPYKAKWENSIKMEEIFLIGGFVAFSKALEKITNSLIGRIFIRKDEWEISNAVLSKFLENVGEKIAGRIKEEYELGNESRDMAKTLLLLFNNLGMENEIKIGKEIEIKMNGKCIFMEGVKNTGVDKIEFPVCLHMINGIKKEFNADFRIEKMKCGKDSICVFKIGKKF